MNFNLNELSSIQCSDLDKNGLKILKKKSEISLSSENIKLSNYLRINSNEKYKKQNDNLLESSNFISYVNNIEFNNVIQEKNERNSLISQNMNNSDTKTFTIDEQKEFMENLKNLNSESKVL